jgi:AraC-like DNA-binding protein
MSRDTLSDLLRAVRLRGAVFFYVEGRDPWVAETPCAKDIVSAILPGADHMMEFHGVARGSCWVTPEDMAPIKLEEGDVVLLPQGDAHIMSSAPGLRAQNPDRHGIFFTPRPPQMPHSLSIVENCETTAHLDGGGCESATLVCGFLGLDARPFNPLLASLPRVLHLPGAATGGGWVSTFLNSAVDESNRKRPGGEAVLERMSEMLFVDVLRRHLDTLPEDETGWLSGMRDPSIGRALALMHERPAEDWTLERLGEATALSRSTLHERFVHFLGQTPMQYLSKWRMQLAARTLCETDAKVLQVALEVGYENEAAFARAFRREVGTSPAAWRRERRAVPVPANR